MGSAEIEYRSADGKRRVRERRSVRRRARQLRRRDPRGLSLGTLFFAALTDGRILPEARTPARLFFGCVRRNCADWGTAGPASRGPLPLLAGQILLAGPHVSVCEMTTLSGTGAGGRPTGQEQMPGWSGAQVVVREMILYVERYTFKHFMHAWDSRTRTSPQ